MYMTKDAFNGNTSVVYSYRDAQLSLNLRYVQRELVL